MQVYITPRAELNFNSIVNYLKQTWGEKTAKEFIPLTARSLELRAENGASLELAEHRFSLTQNKR
ncbi:MAG: hypothetical protein K1X55_09510 [Chitinophagales bacterium]|nr:hypothetical protein [Chitinophagales bacterium]